jgi:hypothetical protein
MSILLFLTAIAVFVTPQMLAKERATEGASQLQGWLLIAQQRAARDQAPRGLRLNINSGTQYVTDLQFIEEPGDFGGGTISAFNGTQVSFQGVDFTGGFPNPSQFPVQVGDFLIIKEGGTPYQISAVTSNALTLASTPSQVNTPTSQYRVVRQARIIAGEDTLQLPQDVAIDLSLSQAGGQFISKLDANSTYIDIMFGKKGGVIGWAAGYDKVVLWVRDTTLQPPPQTPPAAPPNPAEGEQSLIVIYSRTNGIASHPANLDLNVASGDYYVYTRDGHSSGQ